MVGTLLGDYPRRCFFPTAVFPYALGKKENVNIQLYEKSAEQLFKTRSIILYYIIMTLPDPGCANALLFSLAFSCS